MGKCDHPKNVVCEGCTTIPKMLITNCKHPEECFIFIIEDDPHCEWCREIDNLTKSNLSLREQLGKLSVFINSGHAVVNCEQIGMLEVMGGNVIVQGLNANKPITNLTSLKT